MRTRQLVLLAVVGCGDAPTDADQPNRAAFESLVEKSSVCAQDRECVIVGEGCAALCGVSVNSASEGKVMAAATTLNREYLRIGTQCHALCYEQVAYCDIGRCSIRVK